MIHTDDLIRAKFDCPYDSTAKHLLVLYSSPRCGSTFACHVLRDTRICVAHEYFQPFQYRPYLEKRWNIAPDNDSEYISQIVKHRGGPNGILGINLHGRHIKYWEKARHALPRSISETHIRIKRKDLEAQAVSYYIARNTNNWIKSDTRKALPTYNYFAIRNLKKEIVESEGLIDAFIKQNSLPVRTIFYEDFITDPYMIVELLKSEMSDDLFKHSLSTASRFRVETKMEDDPIKHLYVKQFKKDNFLSAIARRVAPVRQSIVVLPIAKQNPYQKLLYSSFTNIKTVFWARQVSFKLLVLATCLAPVVHIHWDEHYTWGSKSSRMSRRRATYLKLFVRIYKLLGGCIAWTMHNARPHRDCELNLFWDVRRTIAKNADLIHVQSNCAKDELLKNFDVDSTKVINISHPSYTDVYGACVNKYAKFENDNTVILFFGRIMSYKGLDYLAKVLGRRGCSSDRLEMIIAGKVEDEQIIRGFRGLGDNICLIPRKISESELSGIFAKCHFMVLPYRQILTSGSAMLGMSFGKPVIAPAIGGLPEVCPKAARSLLYDPNDEYGLDKAIDQAMSMDLDTYRRMSQACLSEAKEKSGRRQSARLLNELLKLR